MLRGKALVSLGDETLAQKALSEARDIAEENNFRRLLWQILALLAEVKDREGDAAAADELRAQARRTVDYVAAHAGDDELRAAFLARPEVARLLRTGER